MQVQHKSRATPVLNPHDKHSPSFFADLVARLNPLVQRLFEGERSPELVTELRSLVCELQVGVERSLASLRERFKGGAADKELLSPLSALAHSKILADILLTILEGEPSDEYAYLLVTKRKFLENWETAKGRLTIRRNAEFDIGQLAKLDSWLTDLGV